MQRSSAAAELLHLRQHGRTARGTGLLRVGTLALCEERRAEFAARLDFFLPALRELGFGIPVQPDGAFYVWADASPLFARLGVRDSSELVELLMRRAHLVVTPSRDFCADDPGTHLRFSTASSMAQLREAVERLRALLA